MFPFGQGVESKYNVYRFVYQKKRFQGSPGAIAKTLAREHEKQRNARTGAGGGAAK
jgi:hypothetical protein